MLYEALKRTLKISKSKIALKCYSKGYEENCRLHARCFLEPDRNYSHCRLRSFRFHELWLRIRGHDKRSEEPESHSFLVSPPHQIPLRRLGRRPRLRCHLGDLQRRLLRQLLRWLHLRLWHWFALLRSLLLLLGLLLLLLLRRRALRLWHCCALLRACCFCSKQCQAPRPDCSGCQLDIQQSPPIAACHLSRRHGNLIVFRQFTCVSERWNAVRASQTHGSCLQQFRQQVRKSACHSTARAPLSEVRLPLHNILCGASS